MKLFRKKWFLGTVIVMLALALVVSSVSISHAAEEDDWVTEAGDYTMWLLGIGAYTGTFFMKDWEGTKQLTYSMGTTIASVTVSKQYFGKMRPDSVDARNSFPSGHAAGAFSSAAFINTRYGYGWGIPAYALAFFTAFSRVHADRHFVDDVTAGASIALFSNWGFVTPYKSKVSVEPLVLEDGYGLKVNIAEGSGPKSDERKAREFRRRHRYEMQLGPAYMRKNEITAPSATGTTFDLNNFNKQDDPTTTAGILYTFFLGERNAVTIGFAPFESRDSGTVSNVDFQGNTYSGDVRSAYRMYDMRLQYAYDLHPEKPWIIDVGGALAVQYTSFELVDAAGTGDAVAEWIALPLAYAKLGYYLSKRFHIDLDSSGMYLSDYQHYDGALMLTYDIDDHWDAGVGYRYFDRRIETSDLKNDVTYDITVLKLAYQW